MVVEATWEQQPDEPAQIYAVARAYFDLGPNRSLKQVAQETGHKERTVERWSARYRWRVRAKAYDAYRLQVEDSERRRVLEELARTEADKWGQRLRVEREEEWHTAQALLAKAREMLACPLEETKWNWRDASALIDQAARLVRTAASESELPDLDADEPGLTVRVEYVSQDRSDAEATQQKTAPGAAQRGDDPAAAAPPETAGGAADTGEV